MVKKDADTIIIMDILGAAKAFLLVKKRPWNEYDAQTSEKTNQIK